ncbi:GNAT family N-acetyltransferase [Bacillus carboniphilus]|uniref:GNAT family N-acetyltransferase n=1 Tax=Bacillus carboniphilus TaxID=86663 RepID=A0ABY9JSX4_9BACI|nr:GNAT family N-acetyltransferase [Bacillus carboniphilus]WLR42491.1 GNAT family N-acetyltransferase [Bacillus carboniphilus]
MKVLNIRHIPKATITEFFNKHWGSSEMVISSGVYQCDELEGYVVINDQKEIIGLVTIILSKEECEIISLDSLVERKGIGSLLMKEVEAYAKNHSCFKMKVTTTNDNLLALGFYQRRGYQITEVIKNAVVQAREIKPQIPMIAENGIPIRDELILEKMI